MQQAANPSEPAQSNHPVIDLVSMHPCAGALHQRSPRFAQYTHQYKLDTRLQDQDDFIVLSETRCVPCAFIRKSYVYLFLEMAHLSNFKVQGREKERDENLRLSNFFFVLP